MRRAAVFLLLLAGSLQADGDAINAYEAYKAAREGAAKEERVYWREFRKRQVDAREISQRPYREMVASMNKTTGERNLRVDNTPYVEMFEEHATNQEAVAQAARALGKSGHEKAIHTLYGALLAAAKEIDAVEEKMWTRTGAGGWGWLDQEPAVRRHGLAIRMRGLTDGLAVAPGAPGFLMQEGYAKARKADRRRSIVRRVAVVDALGRCGDAAARPFLARLAGDPATWMRIAAAEALLRFGNSGRPLLEPLLADPSPVVRRALLDGIRVRSPDDPGWIGPLVARLEKTNGTEREFCLRALTALTRQRFGSDPPRWRKWLEAHEGAIAAGGFDRRKTDVEEAPTRPVEAAIRFYGVSSPASSVVFVLDGTPDLDVPADYDIQKTKTFWDWVIGPRGWRKEHEAHQEAMARELQVALSRLPPDALFGAVMVKESSAFKTVPRNGLMKNSKANRKEAVRFLAKHAPRGFRAELSNLVTAMEMAGLKPLAVPDLDAPRADTIYLIGGGGLRGGPYRDPAAAVAAFARLNRFRRVIVHTIRICNAGEPAERFLKDLAAAAGGSYRWAKKPPR